jgi:hypothetical protein
MRQKKWHHMNTSAKVETPMLSTPHQEALSWLKHQEYECALLSDFDVDRTRGRPTMTIIRALVKIELVVITSEEPDADGFVWTPMVELTGLGKKMARSG